MELVVIESPYGGDIETNTLYALECLKDSLKRGEAPFASHLLYTQVLDDTTLDQRHQGMEAGFAWGKAAQKVAVYTDHGISKGMELGIKKATENKKTIEYRKIYG